MSYSFTVHGRDKGEVKERAREEMDRVVEMQKPHKLDQEAALEGLDRLLELVADPEQDEFLLATLVGSLSGDMDYTKDEVRKVSNISLNCAVRVEKRT